MIVRTYKDLGDVADTLCAGIKENLQHSDIIDYLFNSTGTWHLKPSLKIRQSDFNPDDPREVVRIEVRKFNGEILETKIIRVRNFEDENHNYTEGYVEKYDFSQEPPTGTKDLEISGARAPGGLNYGRADNYQYADDFKNACKVDFKIYWSGFVDVWFDKLIVDDKLGDEIFKNNYDYENIYKESSNFGSHPTNVSFFSDEVKYSNFECIKYVQSKMKQYNPDAELVCIANPACYNLGLRNNEDIFDLFLNFTTWKRVMVDLYQIYAEVHTVPDNLPNCDTRIPSELIGNHQHYNYWIQNKTFGQKTFDPNNTYFGSYIYLLNKLRTKINDMPNKPELIIIPQLFSGLGIVNNKFVTERPEPRFGNGYREPTNEEIQLQAMLALAYGANHLGWFVYTSDETATGCSHGLLNTNFSQRHENLYCQDKWQYISEMNKKILNFKPIFDNTTWKGAFSVHYEGANHFFVNNIRSNYYYSINPPAWSCTENIEGNADDCESVKYWEMGFFEPIGSSDKSKYLLMVNRRCYPDINQGDGDLRNLYIKFNANELPDYNTWKITDVNDNSIEGVEFIKNSGLFVDLGPSMRKFDPGEGKLFKISPVMQSGGTLVCDENIQGGTFTLQDTLYTNGYNLTIGFGTTINFTDSACIIVNGGSFICGDVAQPTHERNIIFKGVTGNSWSGLSFNNCSLVNINSAQFQNVKGDAVNTNFTVKMINCNTVNINNCTFTNSDPQKSGAIEANFSGAGSGETNFYIAGNTFNMNSSDKTIVSVIANAECSVPVMIDNNIFTSTSNSATAVV